MGNQGEDMQNWYQNDFIPTIQQRGAAIIKARGASSAASAANAALMHARDLELGTNGARQSMAVLSNGEYGIAKGLYYSYPVTTNNSEYTIVEGLPVSSFSEERLRI